MLLAKVNKIQKSFINLSLFINLKNSKNLTSYSNNQKKKWLKTVNVHNLLQKRNMNIQVLLPNEKYYTTRPFDILIAKGYFYYLNFQKILSTQMGEFQEASMDAAINVSEALVNENYEYLQNVVDIDLIEKLKNPINNLNALEKQAIKLSKDSTIFSHLRVLDFQYIKGQIEKFEVLLMVYVTSEKPYEDTKIPAISTTANYCFSYVKEEESYFWKINKINYLFFTN